MSSKACAANQLHSSAAPFFRQGLIWCNTSGWSYLSCPVHPGRRRWRWRRFRGRQRCRRRQLYVSCRVTESSRFDNQEDEDGEDDDDDDADADNSAAADDGMYASESRTHQDLTSRSSRLRVRWKRCRPRFRQMRSNKLSRRGGWASLA